MLEKKKSPKWERKCGALKMHMYVGWYVKTLYDVIQHYHPITSQNGWSVW